MAVLTIYRDKVLTFKFLHVSAGLGLPEAQFSCQNRNGWENETIAASVTTEPAVSHFCAQAQSAIPADGFRDEDAVEQAVRVEGFARFADDRRAGSRLG